MQKNMFNYEWYLKDGYPQSKDNSIKANDYKVFGTFINGGGSTMGYKLAGYNHLGGVEIDPKTAKCYKENHNPMHLFVEDLRDFNMRNDLPKELYDLDILDGSPPCTTFSTSGKGQKSQGVEKVFKEGNNKQTLDDLMFVYCDTINKLRPKVFILENVSGLLCKNNQPYINAVMKKLQDYKIQGFLLNSADMGLPQMRNRVFLIGHKKDFDLPGIKLEYSEPKIPFYKISDNTDTICNLTPQYRDYWLKAKQGKACGKFKSIKKINNNKVANTLNATKLHFHPTIPRTLNVKEISLIGSYPLDYKFSGHKPVFYIGMSVPPLMIANIAYQIKVQWLDFIPKVK